MNSTEPLLDVLGLRRTFSGVVAVDDVSLTVPKGALVGVLGANGAGKSTLFHLIAGHLRADQGAVTFAGRDITRLQSHQRAAIGMGLVFQAPRLFPGMSVVDNVMTGRYVHGRSGMLSAFLQLPRHHRDEEAAKEASMAQLERLGLARHAHAVATDLPFGLQRRVAVAQALGVADELLLLDEPAAGLTGGERVELRGVIGGLRDAGLSILLIEHDVRFVATIADSLVVLERGQVLASGPVRDVLADPAVIAAYSGVAA